VIALAGWRTADRLELSNLTLRLAPKSTRQNAMRETL
jgi:hypothetical protein